MSKCKWQVGIYLRLSKEDGDKEESNSISVQRNIIKDFLKNYKNITIYNTYIDDGFTGTDFNRPNFQKLLNDIYSRKVNAVIVKDLSRIGRNYINVGSFIENIIIKSKVRLISINDNVDSYLHPESLNSLEVQFKNLMNESYVKDTSNKIRSSLIASKRNGNFIGAIAPYGYLKKENDCHKFIIDENAASVVRRIFKYAIEGKSKKQIADELNRLNILTPSMYFKKVLKLNIGVVASKWNSRIVSDILLDKSYIGYTTQNRFKRISHKNHSVTRTSQDEWLINKNHHTAIISEEVFNQVQQMMFTGNNKIGNNDDYQIFSGHLKCGDCGSSMYKKNVKKHKDGKTVINYYCSTYTRTKNCTSHHINSYELEELVLPVLNKHIELLSDLKDKIDNFDISNIEYDKDIKNMRLTELNKQIEDQEKLLKELRQDYKTNLVSREDFEDYYNSYLYELNEMRIKRKELETDDRNFDFEWLSDIKTTGKINKLTYDVVCKFIDNIYVYEDKNIEIKFRYQDEYEKVISTLKNANIMV